MGFNLAFKGLMQSVTQNQHNFSTFDRCSSTLLRRAVNGKVFTYRQNSYSPVAEIQHLRESMRIEIRGKSACDIND
jgi:hypothetical protein